MKVISSKSLKGISLSRIRLQLSSLFCDLDKADGVKKNLRRYDIGYTRQQVQKLYLLKAF